MICCPSSAVTAITQKTEMDAIRIVPAFSELDISVVRLRKNGIAPTGLISASNEINDLSRFIAGGHDLDRRLPEHARSAQTFRGASTALKDHPWSRGSAPPP